MAAGDSLLIEVVATRQQFQDFFSLKRKIYRGDPSGVIPLRSMEHLQLDEDRYPFYQHATRRAFICYRNGEAVGRIVAIKDDLHNEFNHDRVGFFGFFETIDDQDVVNQLLETAADWLREKGCDLMRGPVNPSMKSDFGVVVAGNELSPMIMMGHTPKRYQHHLLDAGLKTAKRFFAFRFRSKDSAGAKKQWDRLADAKVKILKRYPQIELREVTKSNFDQTMREVNELGNIVRSEGWGFVPLTDAELDFMINNLRRVIRYDMIHVAYWDNKLVGYIISIPDVNWALQRTVGPWDWMRMIQLPRLIRRTPRTRVIALGVDDDYRNKGIAMLLILGLVNTYDAFEEWEFSWVLEDNIRSIRAIGRTLPLVKTKTYELFEKPI
jgi:GNAT superfamily N-acetyltransferase